MQKTIAILERIAIHSSTSYFVRYLGRANRVVIASGIIRQAGRQELNAGMVEGSNIVTLLNPLKE